MKKKLILIFFIALFCRIFYILLVPPRPLVWDDSAEWNSLALKLMKGEGILSHTEEGFPPNRPPVYPLMIAIVYFIFGVENFFAVKLVQAMIGSLCCLILYKIGELLFNDRIAFWSGFLLALYPPLIVYTEILMSETLYTFLLLSFVAAWINAYRRRTYCSFVYAGICLGILNLCRVTMFYFPLFVLFAFLAQKEKREIIKKSTILVLSSFIIISPWLWRNQKIYGSWLILGGGQFWIGTIPKDERLLSSNAPSHKRLFHGIKDLNQFNQANFKAAFQNIGSNPINYLKLTVEKFFYYLFQPVGKKLVESSHPLLGTVIGFLHFLLILLFIFGFFRSRKELNLLVPVYLVLIYFTCLLTLTEPQPRFRMPIEPLFLLFVAIALERVLPWKERFQ